MAEIGDGETGCACPPTERALRFIADDKACTLSTADRTWCLAEIGRVEGFAVADYERANDPDLARGVLDAWLSFCRDKGLL